MVARRVCLCFAATLLTCVGWSAHLPVPTVSLVINGVDYGPQLAVSRQGALFRFSGTVRSSGVVATANVLVNPDPFVDYGLDFAIDSCSVPNTGCAVAPTDLLLAVIFDDGPWNALASTHRLFVTDADNDGFVSVVPNNVGGFSHLSSVDGVVRHQLGNGCSATGITPGSTVTCDDESAYSIIPPTGSSGVLSMSVRFFPNPGDSYSLVGSAALVPEPSTRLLAGLALMGLFRHRSRRTKAKQT